MKRLFFLLFLVFLVGLGVYGAGSSLPEKTIVMRGGQLPVAQQELWPVLANFEEWPQWQSMVAKINPLPNSSNNNVLWHVTVNEEHSYVIEPIYSVEGEALQFLITENSLPYDAKWAISLIDKTEKADSEGKEPSESQPATFIKITETSHTKNPFARFYMQYVIGYDDDVEQFLRAIAKKFNVKELKIKELVA